MKIPIICTAKPCPPDELIPKYFNLATDLPVKEKQQIAEGLENGTLHPRDAKMLLGKTIVRMYHGTGEADKAELHFKTIFQKGAMPDEIPEAEWKGEGEVLITDLLAGLGLLSSKTEARKMIAGGGIRLNGQKVGDVQMLVKITDGLVLQAGKRKFVKLRLSTAK
jgi:tyrosyl-tRNA synthetase